MVRVVQSDFCWQVEPSFSAQDTLHRDVFIRLLVDACRDVSVASLAHDAVDLPSIGMEECHAEW
jgi:hypothetical protein